MRSIASIPPAWILEWLRHHVKVDPERGTLTWLKPSSFHSQRINKPAGHIRRGKRDISNPKEYWVLRCRKISIKRGWLIFLWVNGRWPHPFLDHINGNSLDDHIINLREATREQNAWNHHKRAKKSDLPMGVRVMGNRYQARIGHFNAQICIGTFDTILEAQAAYSAKRKELFGEFA